GVERMVVDDDRRASAAVQVVVWRLGVRLFFFFNQKTAYESGLGIPAEPLFRSNIQTACLIMEGAEFTENIINGVERPVKAAELFAFTLRVRAGNTDVLTDAEENVRQKLRAE